MSYTFPRWTSATTCSGGATPGAEALMAWFVDAIQTGRNYGIYNCRPVAGTRDLSLHSLGRAVDLGLPLIGGKANPAGHRVVGLLARNALALGVQCIIYDRRIWSAAQPGGAYYGGVSPHYDHVHAELTATAGRYLTLATCISRLGGPAPGRVSAAKVYPAAPASESVRLVQAALNAAVGSTLTADGRYGPMTVAVAKQWQTRLYGSGAGVDGDLGPESLTVLGNVTRLFRVQP